MNGRSHERVRNDLKAGNQNVCRVFAVKQKHIIFPNPHHNSPPAFSPPLFSPTSIQYGDHFSCVVNVVPGLKQQLRLFYSLIFNLIFTSRDRKHFSCTHFHSALIMVRGLVGNRAKHCSIMQWCDCPQNHNPAQHAHAHADTHKCAQALMEKEKRVNPCSDSWFLISKINKLMKTVSMRHPNRTEPRACPHTDLWASPPQRTQRRMERGKMMRGW